MIYEELETMVSNIFASRAKNASKTIISVWAKEIALKGFYDKALMETEKTFMEDDEIPLTLARVISVAEEINERVKNASFKKIDCDYCKGKGLAYSTIFFENNGQYLSQNYAMRCYHNVETNLDMAKMNLNEETHNRTECGTAGYILVFKDVVERDEYLDKVIKNGWKDLWVQEETKSELEAFKPFPMGEGDTFVESTRIIEKVKEELVPEEDIPF